MATTKFKDMSPFWVLSVFGQSYDNYRHAEKLARLFQEIGFKMSAASIAFDLLLEQEKVIQGLHKPGSPSARSYQPEIRQMAYLGFFFDAVYALTERISHVTKIFHDFAIKDGFNSQRKKFVTNHEVNPTLSKLMKRIDWYDFFRELRVQHSHYGTSILGFGYDKKLEIGSSQLIIEISGGEKKKVLTGKRYSFDARRTSEIMEGVKAFIQDWSLILTDKLDENTTISGKNDPKETSLKDFIKGRVHPITSMKYN